MGVNAATFQFENFKLEWDTVFTAGVQYRIEKRSKRISEGSDGMSGQMDSLPGLIDNAFIINSNDGNNNFARGFTSQRVSILSEADFNFGDWGVFVRGKTWQDFRYGQKSDMNRRGWAENNANPVFGYGGGNSASYGEFSPATRGFAESGHRLLDLFWYGKFRLFEHDFSLRLGRQVISWGEAMLSGGGISMATGHVDAHARNQPGLEIKEMFLPNAAIYLQTDITDTISLEAYYQLEWNPVHLDPSGTFFSEFDSIGSGGNNFMFASGTEDRILGKDLRFNDDIYNDQAYANALGQRPRKGRLADCLNDPACLTAWEGHYTTDADRIYSKNLDNLLVFLPTTCDQNSTATERSRCQGLIPYKVREDKASDKGQFGLALKFFLDNGDELGLYYVNYHEKIPNFILPIDAIEQMSPIIDLLVRVADKDCYFGTGDHEPECGNQGSGQPLAERGGFSGINDLNGKLSLKQINALLLFLSALPEDKGTIGEITFDLVRNPNKMFGDDPGLANALTNYIASDPLLAAVATAASMAGANAILGQYGFSTNTEIRSINYRLQYAENVHLLGGTYSTILGSANVATEITYRENTPLLLADVPRTPKRFKLINWHVNMLQVFEPVSLWGNNLWDFSTLVAEVLVWHVPGALEFDKSNRDNLNPNRLAVQNTPNGIGASVFWSLEYHNVFTGWDIMVPVYLNWGVYGAMFNSGYRDGQAQFATGLTFSHLSGVELGFGVNTFFGDTDDIFQMLTQDRDNVTLHFKYSF